MTTVDVAMGIGLIVQTISFILVLLKLSNRQEHRLTALETKMDLILHNHLAKD